MGAKELGALRDISPLPRAFVRRAQEQGRSSRSRDGRDRPESVRQPGVIPH